MEKKESKIKEKVVTGASSVIGAAAGVVGANVVAQSVNAAEVTDQEEILEQHETAPISPNPSRPQEAHENVDHPEDPIATPDEPQVEVLGYETLTNEDGSQVDAAVVAIDGQQVIIADTDQDDIANVMAADLNGNGTIEEHEIVDISGEGIAMSPLQAAVDMGGDDTLLADNSTPDYVNDANVDAYMA